MGRNSGLGWFVGGAAGWPTRFASSAMLSSIDHPMTAPRRASSQVALRAADEVMFEWTIMPNNRIPKMNEMIALGKIARWEKVKALVLDSVSSPITKRVYNMALNEFMTWFQQAPRPGFTKATVHAWRVSLEERGLGSSSIIIRMSAIRKLAAEAADNGLLAAEMAAGIRRVKSVKSVGIRVGNWLSQRQAQTLLNAPDITTVNGLRDRAILRCSSGLRVATIGSCGAYVRACPATRRPLVHRRPRGETRASSHRADADLGEGDDRRMD